MHFEVYIKLQSFNKKKLTKSIKTSLFKERVAWNVQFGAETVRELVKKLSMKDDWKQYKLYRISKERVKFKESLED